jgi:dolichol-phosphate mannosyltransferase
MGERGLSAACIAGVNASSSPYIAVMDADMQHDEKILPNMLEKIRHDDLDIVVGSRYVAGGSATGGLNNTRSFISQFATNLSRLVLREDLSDPMSGYFVVSRRYFQQVQHNLSGKGFKILLDLFVSSKSCVKFEEIPYEMRPRLAGESKLDSVAVREYLILVFDKSIGRIIPVSFVLFVLVGVLGAIWHLAFLALFLNVIEFSFIASQTLATLIAMTSNFILNNLLTFRERMLKGLRFIRGLMTFYVACSIGAVINFALSQYLFENAIPWWLAGLLGASVGAFWNYGISSLFTWRRKL